MDPIILTNLILCVVILILGCIGYCKTKDIMPLLVGIAFGLFGVSHLMTLLGLREALTTFLIVIRTIAYLLVLSALYRIAFRK